MASLHIATLLRGARDKWGFAIFQTQTHWIWIIFPKEHTFFMCQLGACHIFCGFRWTAKPPKTKHEFELKQAFKWAKIHRAASMKASLIIMTINIACGWRVKSVCGGCGIGVLTLGVAAALCNILILRYDRLGPLLHFLWWLWGTKETQAKSGSPKKYNNFLKWEHTFLCQLGARQIVCRFHFAAK